MAALWAVFPDVDYAAGFWRGYLNTTHQWATHSILWCALVSLGVVGILRVWTRKPAWKYATWVFVLLMSHLLIDMFTEDRMPPYGIPLLWPFSDAPFHFPVHFFGAWSKTALADLWRHENIIVLGRELIAGVMGLTACVCVRRKWLATHPGK